jgi:hypothetical protein
MRFKHGTINTLIAIDLDSFESLIQGLIDCSAFCRRELPQHVGNHVMTWIGAIDAHTQAVKLTGAQYS